MTDLVLAIFIGGAVLACAGLVTMLVFIALLYSVAALTQRVFRRFWK